MLYHIILYYIIVYCIRLCIIYDITLHSQEMTPADNLLAVGNYVRQQVTAEGTVARISGAPGSSTDPPPGALGIN